MQNNITELEEEVYVPCLQERKDCFSYREDGTCDCLIDTEFKKKCPFYKNKKEYEEQRQADMKKKRANPSKPF